MKTKLSPEQMRLRKTLWLDCICALPPEERARLMRAVEDDSPMAATMAAYVELLAQERERPQAPWDHQ